MKIIGINGSPRIGGNTDILVDKALEGAKSKGAEVEKIILNVLKFSPCQECENLPDDVNCILNDDMQIVYRKIIDADGIILGSPIFFGSVSAQMKMMIDRFQCFWRAKFVLKKVLFKKKKAGGFIAVASSSKKDFFENAKSIVKNLFVCIDTVYKAELFCSKIDEKGSILGHSELLEKAFELGAVVAGGGKLCISSY